MALSNVDKTYAKVRIDGINAQIKEHRAAIKRLEARKRTFSNANQTDDTTPDDELELADDNGDD